MYILYTKKHFLFLKSVFLILNGRPAPTLKCTNLQEYFNSHIDNNIEDYKQQIKDWYELFKYSFDRNLFNLI